MTEIKGWNWVECLFKRISLPYYIVSMILGLIIYFGYVFFGIMIHQFPFIFYANLSAVSMCTMIAYELAGIQYLLNVMKRIFSYWSSLSEEYANNICTIAKKRFTESYLYFILVFLVITPFYLIDWIHPSEQNFLKNFMNHLLPIYSMIPTKWGFIFDIYLQLLGILALFLLAIILWIMANITWTLRSPPIFPLNYPPKMNVFSTKKRVNSIRGLILKVLTYYFICISLAIISYLNPMIFYSKETFLLLMLLLIGVLFFFIGLESIQRFLRDRVEYELDEINKKCQEQIQRLTSIASDEDHNAKSNELNYAYNLLDAFQKHRERHEGINTNLYNISSIGRFIGAFLLPFITETIMLNPALILHLLDNLHNIINYLLPK